jgi:hypothetical protein
MASWSWGMTVPPLSSLEPGDPLVRPVGEVQERALLDLAGLAVALAQQDRRRRAAIGDRFDIHGSIIAAAPAKTIKSIGLHGYISVPSKQIRRRYQSLDGAQRGKLRLSHHHGFHVAVAQRTAGCSAPASSAVCTALTPAPPHLIKSEGEMVSVTNRLRLRQNEITLARLRLSFRCGRLGRYATGPVDKGLAAQNIQPVIAMLAEMPSRAAAPVKLALSTTLAKTRMLSKRSTGLCDY